jgi:hypothetical protein
VAKAEQRLIAGLTPSRAWAIGSSGDRSGGTGVDSKHPNIHSSSPFRPVSALAVTATSNRIYPPPRHSLFPVSARHAYHPAREGLNSLLVSTLLRGQNLCPAPIAIVEGERVDRLAVWAWPQQGVLLELPPEVKGTPAVATVELLDSHRRLLAHGSLDNDSISLRHGLQGFRHERVQVLTLAEGFGRQPLSSRPKKTVSVSLTLSPDGGGESPWASAARAACSGSPAASGFDVGGWRGRWLGVRRAALSDGFEPRRLIRTLRPPAAAGAESREKAPTQSSAQPPALTWRVAHD